MKAIVNGKIILKDCVLENQALLFSDKIEAILPIENLPEGTQKIDANGGYVAPGLIDLHIHGYLGKDVCDGDEEGIRTISKGLLSNGVTGYLPTTSTTDMADIKKALETCRKLKEESKSWCGSTILGCHTEGPFINESKKGAQDARYILKPDANFVKEYSDIISIITIAPETDTPDFAEIREIKKSTNVIVSIGHTAANYETAMASFKAGVSHVTHLFNAMTALAHRAPGVVTAALNADVSCELIADTIHVNPALYNMLWKLKGRNLCIITDCLSAGGLPAGEYALGLQKIIYDGNICKLEDGTISGSGLHFNKGVWNLYKNSDIPLYECVNCGSLNPATKLGLQNRKGSLDVGKDADIIITDNEFNVKNTIIGGVTKYEA